MTTEFSLLHRRLETEQKSLMERLMTNVRPAGERRESSPHSEEGEAATETLELERCRALDKLTRDLLAEVEHALHKFELGTYGLCDVCGQPIEPARLEALPQANLCLSCKAAENARGGKK